MLNNAERMAALKKRAVSLKRRRMNKEVALLKATNLVLAVMLILFIGRFSGIYKSGTVIGPYGAILLADGACGYVLTAVTAFVFATIFTVACIKLKEKNKQNKGEGKR